MSKKITTVYIDEDKQEWIRIQRERIKFNFSDWLNKVLDELIPQADLLLIRNKRLNIEKSINSQKMAEVDKYGATK